MVKPKAALIDYGMGNLGSVAKALQTVGLDVKITSDKGDLERAEAIVLPGVGAFGDAIKRLKELKLDLAIKREVLDKKKPFLGICLGLQLLFEESYEFGKHKGLEIFEGEVLHFGDNVSKVPHMGWNEIHPLRDHPILESLKDGDFFYFVHSYYVKPKRRDIILTETDYEGFYFTSGVAYENIVAFQFHPEKSQKKGLKLLENFKRLVENSI
ncbi:MAG TPA: imidazole glycerol phosphate synthase subunit HisH [Aquifex aeolicus]|uniref:Imidazole glycerol phosphate synthase subunit HisH n=1 Tax=Aquifex aeolicus TaxID=63363 RepID=A0A9D0YPY2_AQUAO|nr:imidazole glycerol phosphate synthase subunit HisH [Aquifex aeolicus]